MAFLAAAVVVVGPLCLLDLVLTLGVIRQLRQHATLLGRLQQERPGGFAMAAGETVADFAATTTGGEAVSRELLGGRSLVGFFLLRCQPCAQQLPRFVEFARSVPGGAERVLAVVAGGPIEETEYARQLAPVARVVIEEARGPVQAAFQVRGFPTLYLVDAGGVVAAAGPTMSAVEGAPALPATQGARAARG
jgi:hypothetical protein